MVSFYPHLRLFSFPGGLTVHIIKETQLGIILRLFRSKVYDHSGTQRFMGNGATSRLAGY